VLVMYAGELIEEATVIDLFDRPFHPYTRGLLRSLPRLPKKGRPQKKRLIEIPGTVPSLIEPVLGCKFADRCLHAFDICRQKPPERFPIRKDQWARCWLKPFPEKRKPTDV